MSKMYNFKEDDSVIFIRNRNIVNEREIALADVGTITRIRDIEKTPYIYSTLFELPDSVDSERGNEEYTPRIVKRFLHGDQIGLISDSEEYRRGQIVIIDDLVITKDTNPDSPLSRLEARLDNCKVYGNLAYIQAIPDEKSDKLMLRIPGLNYIFCEKEDIKDCIRPLTLLKLKNNFGLGENNYNKLKYFLRDLGKDIDFQTSDFSKCIKCSDWINNDTSDYARDEGYICKPCTEEYIYCCDGCEKEYIWAESQPRWLDITLGKVSEELGFKRIKVCRDCSDTKVFTCKRCNYNFLNAKYIYYHSEQCCEECFNSYCLDVMTSPPRALHRSNINRILLPDDKVYTLNKSKTPVAVEIECISEYEFETDGNEAYFEPPPGGGWTDTYDGSLSDYGREFVMRPEVGDAALKRIKRFCDWALENNWYIDNSCGLHVHTDAFYMGVNSLKGVLLTIRALEPFIYKMLPISRYNSRYSSPMSTKASTEDILEVKTFGEFCELWYLKMNEVTMTADKYNDSRYRGFNLHSRILHGTIEYRYHHGTLNFESIASWLRFCLSISDFGSKLLMPENEKIKNLFIKQESKDFSDYISAMGAEDLIPYVQEMISRQSNDGEIVSDHESGWEESQDYHY